MQTVGRAFDPAEHEAVQHVASTEVPPGAIVTELQPGYRWQGRLMRPALVVVSGRRRVGKSALLDAAFEGRRLLSFQADEQDERGQLELLAEEASRLLPGQPPLRFDDWPAAVRFIEAQAAAEPLVVVLDEFQWLCAAQRARLHAIPAIVREIDESTTAELALIVAGTVLLLA